MLINWIYVGGSQLVMVDLCGLWKIWQKNGDVA